MCVLCLSLACLTACATNPGGRASVTAPQKTAGASPDAPTLFTGAERADPSYIQYLEKQSFLYGAAEAARIVSGSQLSWQTPASPASADLLLHLSPSWVAVNPLSLLTDPRQPALSTLSSPVLSKVLTSAHISGLYISPTSGSGRLWAYDRVSGVDGEDIVQFGFSEAAGGQEDYLRLLSASNNANRLLGMDAVPAATGMGPDFFLAARNTRGYPGLYCMVEIPREYWGLLPEAPSQWRGEALPPDTVRSLATRGLLPLSMLSERLSFPLHKRREGGWAATAEIRGVDGSARRWAYRYHGSPEFPVLNWEDPSRAARRVMAASAIQNVGLQGSAIVGLNLESLFGLEADTPDSGQMGLFLEPGLAAAKDMGREIRRYGGWSLLRNELPLTVIAGLMEDGPDLIFDSITSPAAEHALLTGDASLLRFMTDEMLSRRVDSRRLARFMPAEGGISYTLPHLADLANRFPGTEAGEHAAKLRAETQFEMRSMVESALFDTPKGRDLTPIAEETLYTPSAGLAALALGAGNSYSVTADLVPMIRQGQALLAFYKAMQPGLFVLSGADLAGTLPLSWRDARDNPNNWDAAMTSRGAYSFQESASSLIVTPGGIPRAKTIHASPDIQAADPESFLSQIGRILGIRDRLGVARGEFHGRFLVKGKGAIAFAVLLPGQGPAPTAPSEELSPVPASERSGMFLPDPSKTKAEQLQMARDAVEGHLRTFSASDQGFTPGTAAIVVVCNFSQERTQETIDCGVSPTLQRLLRQGRMTRIASVGQPQERIGSQSVTVYLGPWQAAAYLLGKAPQDGDEGNWE